MIEPGMLTRAQYREFSDAVSGADWTPATRAYHLCCDFAQRIKLSGLWCVALAWAPEYVRYADPPMSDAEVSSMKTIQNNAGFLAWWSQLLARRDGAAPSDFVARVVVTNELRDVVDSYAEPLA